MMLMKRDLVDGNRRLKLAGPEQRRLRARFAAVSYATFETKFYEIYWTYTESISSMNYWPTEE